MPGLSYLKSILFSGVIIILLFGCNENDKASIEKSASVFDIKQAEASITQSNENFMKSFKAGDSLGVASCYTTDPKIMAPGTPSIKESDDIMHYINQSMKKGF